MSRPMVLFVLRSTFLYGRKMTYDYANAIANSGLKIYDEIDPVNPDLWVPTLVLEEILNDALAGKSLTGLALRTRSRVAKEYVCRALGYPVPRVFKRTQPRFVGQRFDTYVQKANNLQIWNEEVSDARRYVIIRVDETDKITRVRVLDGDDLAKLDTTGTLTQKYQARLITGSDDSELIASEDTPVLERVVRPGVNLNADASPLDHPRAGTLMPIAEVFQHLRTVVGYSFTDPGIDQERKRAATLHSLVCDSLGYASYKDDGRFPDIRNQLLEVKLQTSPTIDLGLVRPDSLELLDAPRINDIQVRHCDIRYALFYAKTDGKQVTLTHFFLTTGASFFERFPQFQGKVLNKKLQIPLPSDFFDG